MQQLNLSELISICASFGYFTLDFVSKLLDKELPSFFKYILSTCAGVLAVWVTMDPYPITLFHLVVGGVSGLLSKFLISAFKSIKDDATASSTDKKLDQALEILKRLEK